MRILDSTASERSIWYQKDCPFTIFMDKRRGKFTTMTENTKEDHGTVVVKPNVIAEWEHLPFKNGVFDMVVFDPPQIFKNEGQKLSSMIARYGVLYNHNWRTQIRDGAMELFRVLKPEGIFILKWNDTGKPVDDVLKLMPFRPLFGTRTGTSNKTHWIAFTNIETEHRLTDYESHTTPRGEPARHDDRAV